MNCAPGNMKCIVIIILLIVATTNARVFRNLDNEFQIRRPGDYSEIANYTDVSESNFGPLFKTIRICVTSKVEYKKCKLFSSATFSRNNRSRFGCVEENSYEECFSSLEKGRADTITVDGSLVLNAEKYFNLKPILSEVYGDLGSSFYSVAVVRKNSTYKSLADLRGVRSCHTGYGDTRNAGYNAPLYNLIKLGLIKPDQCPYSTALSKFFNGSCMAGAKTSSDKLPETIIEKLCSQCGGHGDSKCSGDTSEPYVTHEGSFRCLVEGKGDVAFAKHITVPKNTDGRSTDEWTDNLKSHDFELLCPIGGRAPIDQFAKCNLAHLPSRMVITSNSKSSEEIEEIITALSSAADFYSKRPDLFRLFGIFEDQHDLLFKDTATALVATHKEIELLEDYVELLSVVRKCK